eukprot:Hpha_TRINITY_DN15596_c2_g4::TRINITY_DN15596_c2_g4_i1::g.105295::m.105295
MPIVKLVGEKWPVKQNLVCSVQLEKKVQLAIPSIKTKCDGFDPKNYEIVKVTGAGAKARPTDNVIDPKLKWNEQGIKSGDTVWLRVKGSKASDFQSPPASPVPPASPDGPSGGGGSCVIPPTEVPKLPEPPSVPEPVTESVPPSDPAPPAPADPAPTPDDGGEAAAAAAAAEAERVRKEEEAKQAQAKAEQEAREKAEQEAKAKAEREAREAQEAREAKEKADGEAKEKAEQEERERAEKEAERLKAEQDATEKADREAKEKADREAKEKAEKDAQDAAKADQEDRERAEKEAKEKADREAKEKADEEAKEKADREAREKADREEQVKLEREALQKAEQEAREQADKDAKERAERERANQEAQQMAERERVQEAPRVEPRVEPERGRAPRGDEDLLTELERERRERRALEAELARFRASSPPPREDFTDTRRRIRAHIRALEEEADIYDRPPSGAGALLDLSLYTTAMSPHGDEGIDGYRRRVQSMARERLQLEVQEQVLSLDIEAAQRRLRQLRCGEGVSALSPDFGWEPEAAMWLRGRSPSPPPPVPSESRVSPVAGRPSKGRQSTGRTHSRDARRRAAAQRRERQPSAGAQERGRSLPGWDHNRRVRHDGGGGGPTRAWAEDMRADVRRQRSMSPRDHRAQLGGVPPQPAAVVTSVEFVPPAVEEQDYEERVAEVAAVVAERKVAQVLAEMQEVKQELRSWRNALTQPP